MQVIAFHNLEDVASLLTDITLITEVEVVAVQTLEKFRDYLNKYKFSAAYILDKFFEEAISLLLKEKNYPKAILVLLQNEQALEKFLRLGLSEQNVETIPFNPLALFVKTKALVNLMKNIEISLNQGVKTFDFYRIGLFNFLNYLTSTEKNLFVSVKDIEKDEVLYSLRIVNGQVTGCSLEVAKVASINVDDSIPKTISIEPVEHKDLEIFKDTAEFYSSLLQAEAKEEVPKVTVEEKVNVELVSTFRENPFRERRIYRFPYKGYEILTQPPEELKGATLNQNSVVVCSELTERVGLILRTFLRRNPNLKVLAPKLIKLKLKQLGFSENNFLNLEGVRTFDFPFLGSKFEGAVFFPNGILITGNLFGSFVSKDIPFFDRILSNHLKLFHYANISSNERLSSTLNTLEREINGAQYIFPNYGYAIDVTGIETAWGLVKQISIPESYTSLADGWQTLAQAYNIEAASYEEFIKKLEKLDGSIVFALLDDMEVLGILPFEF